MRSQFIPTDILVTNCKECYGVKSYPILWQSGAFFQDRENNEPFYRGTRKCFLCGNIFNVDIRNIDMRKTFFEVNKCPNDCKAVEIKRSGMLRSEHVRSIFPHWINYDKCMCTELKYERESRKVNVGPSFRLKQPKK